MFGLINITPGSQVIPGVPIGWYGVAYVIGLAALLLVSQREAELRALTSPEVRKVITAEGIELIHYRHLVAA